jgi:release factor glutamine methyltransferase
MSMAEGVSDDVWTVGRLLKWTTSWLARHEVPSPRLSSELVIAHALACRKIDLYLRFEYEPIEAELAAIRSLVRRAAAHEPIAYVVGHKEFYSLDFEVTPDVLIPRPETETLVQQAVELCRAASDATVTVLDVGTGSGCVAISIAKYAPNAVVTASDVSDAALAIARRNAERHGVGGAISFAAADCVGFAPGVAPAGGFDLLVSNPPYVAEAEYEALDRAVREYEPRISLAGGADGLAFYRRLAAEAGAVVRGGGAMLLEIGAGQRDAVVEILTRGGEFRHAGTYRDPSDPHDRVVHVVRDGP